MSRVTRTTLAVIGAGTMGRGIALTAVAHGCDVVVFDTDISVARRAADAALVRPGPDGSASKSASKSADDSAGENANGQVTVAESIAAAVVHADAVIESVVESAPAKAAVLREMAAAAGPDTLLATNTSTFSIARLAVAGGCEGRLIGMHFFNPAERMRLVEVVVPDDLPEKYVSRCADLAEMLGKTPVIVKDSPGFITSRLGLALGNEAMLLVESGIAEPPAIDAAMRLGYNHPMGPLELADLVGLDARLNNLNALHLALDDGRYQPPRILIDLVAAGHLGRKTGRGFYLYDADGRKLDVAPRDNERGHDRA
jgi:3-hydroxybutyryl-CoA dehydrogenase